MQENLDLIVIGYCLTNKANLTQCIETAQVKYFRTKYRKLFSMIKKYKIKTGELLTEKVVESSWKKRGKKEDELAILLKMMEDAKLARETEHDFPYYLEELKRRHAEDLLRIALQGKDSEGVATGEKTAVEFLLDHQPLKAWDCLKKAGLNIENAVRADQTKRFFVHERASIKIQEYQKIKENPQEALGLLTGFDPLDDATRGLKGGEMLVVAGRAGSGKSISALQMAVNIYKQGKDILLISLEMPAEQYEDRFFSCHSDLPLHEMQKGQLTEEQEAAYNAQWKQIEQNPTFFEIVDTVSCNAMRVEAELSLAMERYEPDILVIDYLGIMKANEKQPKDNEEQAAVVEEVRALARVYDKPIITAVQLNRDPKKKSVGTERLSRSDVIGHTVDIAIQIEERETDELSDDIWYHVIKNRKGQSGFSFPMFKRFETMTIGNK